jgi:hypothetical protein
VAPLGARHYIAQCLAFLSQSSQRRYDCLVLPVAGLSVKVFVLSVLVLTLLLQAEERVRPQTTHIGSEEKTGGRVDTLTVGCFVLFCFVSAKRKGDEGPSSP